MTVPDDEAEARSATVLIVDDAPLNLTVLGELLQPLYRVRVASSGEAALRQLAGSSPPDLILLDIMMPGIDGFEVLRQLRAAPDTRDIPVIFVTAVHDDEAEQRGFELGAADYIHKPIRGPVVLARVRAQLQARAAREILRKNNLRLEQKVEEGAHALENAQMQLLQSEKMAAMGQLAAGVAHEINNPIGYIGSNLGSLEKYIFGFLALFDAYERAEKALPDASPFDEVHRLSREIEFDHLRTDVIDLIRESKEGVERVRRIVLDLKDFSRTGDVQWQWADIHQCLDSTLNIVWHELKYHCTVTKHYGNLPRVHCLASQLNQVFMNLLVNAGQAIEGQGEITITTEPWDDGQSIRVSISDTGPGIPPEHRQKIFEPFFTTKPVGKGTGLGLSLAWSIIARHHGRIDVESIPGKGTTFSVIVPVCHGQTEAGPRE